MEAVAWHFLLHVTMVGGPGANRAAILLRQPRSEGVTGFLCHGAATSEEFKGAVENLGESVLPVRDKLIESISQEKIQGVIPEPERDRVKKLQQFSVGPNNPENPFSEALEKKETVFVRSPKESLRDFYERLGWEPPQDAIVLPLLFEGEFEGLLYADKAFIRTGICDSGDDKVLQAPCTHLAAAARSARLAEQLRHQVLGFSHSSLAPITAINGLANVLIPEISSVEQKRVLELIVAEAGRGSDQLRRMLNIARLSGGATRAERNRIEIHSLVRERIKPYEVLLREEGIKVLTAIPEDHFYADVDTGLLGAAIAELAANALAAIRTSGIPMKDRYLAVRCEQDIAEASTVITFENSCRRVPAEVRGRMFEPFVSGSGSTGLGLSYVRDALKLHGGSVDYLPIRETVSRFVVRCPNREVKS
jgi:signal transduction histidine kinase